MLRARPEHLIIDGITNPNVLPKELMDLPVTFEPRDGSVVLLRTPVVSRCASPRHLRVLNEDSYPNVVPVEEGSPTSVYYTGVFDLEEGKSLSRQMPFARNGTRKRI